MVHLDRMGWAATRHGYLRPMITPIDPDHPGLIWHAVVGQILTLVRTGKLKPGARLPSIPDLAREFGVATKTVQRALGWLAEQGVVVTFPGRGTFIATNVPKPLPTPPGRSS